MSILDELMKKLCSYSIEYKKIGDICTVYTGGEAPDDFIRSKEPDGEYIYPIYSNGIDDNAIYGYSKGYRISEAAVTYSSIGTIGYPTIRSGKFTPIIRLKVIIPNTSSELSLGFLKYALEIAGPSTNISSVANVNSKMIKNIEIPVPPIEVQEEIVSILDDFTKYTEGLIEELKRELIARKKQYEYYKEELFKVNCNTRVVKISDIADISRGGNFKKTDFTDVGVPCIHYGQIYTRYGFYASESLTNITEEAAKKAKYASKNDIVMAVTSENIQDVCKAVAWLGKEDIAVGGHTAIIKHKQNAKYLSYYFSTSIFSKQKAKLAQGTKVLDVAPNKLLNVEIPLPSLDEQEIIVDKLDRLSNSYDDISISLQEEIKMRKKQGDYYREKLLTFKELEE